MPLWEDRVKDVDQFLSREGINFTFRECSHRRLQLLPSSLSGKKPIQVSIIFRKRRNKTTGDVCDLCNICIPKFSNIFNIFEINIDYGLLKVWRVNSIWFSSPLFCHNWLAGKKTPSFWIKRRRRRTAVTRFPPLPQWLFRLRQLCHHHLCCRRTKKKKGRIIINRGCVCDFGTLRKVSCLSRFSSCCCSAIRKNKLDKFCIFGAVAKRLPWKKKFSLSPS